MFYIFNPLGAPFQRKDPSDFTALCGTPNPSKVEQAWAKALATAARTRDSSKLRQRLTLLRYLRKHWEKEERRAREELVELVLAEGHWGHLAQELRCLADYYQRLDEAIGTVAKKLDRVLSEREKNRPADSLVESMGYNLDLFGLEGLYQFQEEWFYRPKAPLLYRDRELTLPICPACACVGLFLLARCGCTSPTCTCSDS